MSRLRWSYPGELRLTRFWNEGLAVKEIATKMGITARQVMDGARRKGLKRRRPPNIPWPAELRAELGKLWAAGEPQSAIAKKLGCSIGAVAGQVRRSGLPSRKGLYLGSRKAAKNRAAKTVCSHGHPLSGDNLYITPTTGSRSCKICRMQLAEAAKLRARR